MCIPILLISNIFNSIHESSSFVQNTITWSRKNHILHDTNEEKNGFGLPGNSNKLKKDMESLYTSDELFNVLNTHLELQDQLTDDGDNDSANPFSLHDLVQMTIQEQEETIFTESRGDSSETIMKSNAKKISIIASDVDGTLLSSSQTLHPTTISNIKQTIDNDIPFFPATGKSRKGALDSIGPELSSILNEGRPGVYLQGLYCLDGEGNVVFEQKLNEDAIRATYELAVEMDVSFVGYDGDTLYSHEITPIVEHLHTHYGEPMAIQEDVTQKKLHKILLMHDDIPTITKLRPLLEKVAQQTNATVTQAIPTMLELLPSNCSKALGVQKVCNALNSDINTLMAMGDAENDAEMLRMACIGIAVENACDVAKAASDFVLDVGNDDGAVGYALDLFLRYRDCDDL